MCNHQKILNRGSTTSNLSCKKIIVSAKKTMNELELGETRQREIMEVVSLRMKRGDSRDMYFTKTEL